MKDWFKDKVQEWVQTLPSTGAPGKSVANILSLHSVEEFDQRRKFIHSFQFSCCILVENDLCFENKNGNEITELMLHTNH